MKHAIVYFSADINECDGPLNQCAFRCANTYGSFRCICPMGYKMAADGLHCEGMVFISHSMFLFSGLKNTVECQNHFSLKSTLSKLSNHLLVSVTCI